MSASFYDLMKYAATGIASPDMTYYDKMRASTLMGGATVQTLTGIPPLSFPSDGTPLISWSMLGNEQQTGTPSPDNIIMPTFCGKLVGSDWTIPITCAGQTVPVYLGQVQTVRRVKKLVLTGNEVWIVWNGNYFSNVIDRKGQINSIVCSHFINDSAAGISYNRTDLSGLKIAAVAVPFVSNVNELKQWLADEYAAGHPVIVWYVPNESETGIVNEPLAKIGDYADELHSDDAGVTIPTAKGQNTLTVETDLQPSEMTIKYRE